MPDVLFERSPEGVATLTLNRPESLNAFTFAMYDELIGVLEELRHDAATRVVILTGAGRAFCAGHDLRCGGPGLRLRARRRPVPGRPLGQVRQLDPQRRHRP